MKLLVDSGCDLSEEILDKYNIDMIPLVVMKDEVEYYDKETIDPDQLYKGMRNGNIYKTAQVPPEKLVEKFSYYADKGESVIYLSFSSGLSGNFQTACLIKNTLEDEYENLDIEIIDTKAASVGIGLIANEVGKLIEQDKTKEEILEVIDYYIENMEHIFTVEEMTYLYKGGRINSIEAMAGKLLSIKPILNIDSDGRLMYQDKARGNKKLIKKIEQLIKDKSNGNNLSEESLGIVYGDNYDFAMEMKNMIESKFSPKEIIIDNMGSAIASHTGPGIIGITFVKKI